MKEKVLLIGEEPPMVGILSEPDQDHRDPTRPAVVILNAGTLHRVGPNRMHVNLARALAKAGFPVLRFDSSGFGDSPVRSITTPIEERLVDEVQEAMDTLESKCKHTGFVLLGLCSGAGFAFRTAMHDPRIAGAVMINPPWHVWDQPLYYRTLARHFVRIALFSSFRAKNWRKLFTLRFDVGLALRSMRKTLSGRGSSGPPLVDGLAGGLNDLVERGTRVFVLHSEGDEGLDYYQMHLDSKVRQLDAARGVHVATLLRANHTFSLLEHQQRAIEDIKSWICKLAG